MKRFSLLLCVALICVLFSCDQNGVKQESLNPDNNVELNNAFDSVSYAIGINVARTLNGQGFDSINYIAFNKAISASLNSDSLLLDQKQSMRYINNYLVKQVNALSEKNLIIASKYLDSISQLQDVKKLDEGIYLRILQPGKGKIPQLTDEVSFNFEGKLPDGTTFDSSFDRGVPVTFVVNSVIEGWQTVLLQLPTGTTAEMWLHPDKAYGTQGGYFGIIPANSAVYYKIELLNILP